MGLECRQVCFSFLSHLSSRRIYRLSISSTTSPLLSYDLVVITPTSIVATIKSIRPELLHDQSSATSIQQDPPQHILDKFNFGIFLFFVFHFSFVVTYSYCLLRYTWLWHPNARDVHSTSKIVFSTTMVSITLVLIHIIYTYIYNQIGKRSINGQCLGGYLKSTMAFEQCGMVRREFFIHGGDQFYYCPTT